MILYREWPYKPDLRRVSASEMSNEQLTRELGRYCTADVAARRGMREYDERTRNAVNRIISELMLEALKRGLPTPEDFPE